MSAPPSRTRRLVELVLFTWMGVALLLSTWWDYRDGCTKLARKLFCADEDPLAFWGGLAIFAVTGIVVLVFAANVARGLRADRDP